MKFLFRLAVILLLFPSGAFAQFDTSYAIKYPDRVGISIFQSNPSYVMDITQNLHPDPKGISNIHYTTLAKNVTGFGFFYDKISLFLGWKSPLNREEKIRKGRTALSQFALAITGTRLRLEAVNRTYRGLYDAYSPNYIPNFNDSTPYFQNPDLRNHVTKIKALYFLSKKKRFSYGAAYVNNVRQVKSAGSLVLSSNLYYFNMNAPSIIPSYLDTMYRPWQSWNEMDVSAVSCGLGYTHTFTIFKRAFINVLFTLGLEERHIRQYSATGEPVYDSWIMSVNSYDFRSSFGFNTKHFFISIQTIVDGTNYIVPSMTLRTSFISGFVNIGYRFHVKTPGFYKRIQETKVYKMI